MTPVRMLMSRSDLNLKTLSVDSREAVSVVVDSTSSTTSMVGCSHTRINSPLCSGY